MNESELLERCKDEAATGWRSTRERYFAVEPDGKLDHSGYVQRPAAERRIRNTGKGLYDQVNQELVVKPDTQLSLIRLRQARDYTAGKLADLDERISALLDLQATEREEVNMESEQPAPDATPDETTPETPQPDTGNGEDSGSTEESSGNEAA